MKNCLIITGASRGIGQAIAQWFRDHHWRVINISRSPCPVDGVENIAADLSQPHWPIEQLTELLDDQQKICLVHNAFYYEKDTVTSVNPESFIKACALNLQAPFHLNKICVPLMAAGSSIIYIGSTLSEKAVANAASYCVMKHAVVGLMRATCQDLAGSYIHTACVCPGFTETEMLKQHCQHDEKILAQLAQRMAIPRLVQPSEIADVVYYCAQTAVINGAVLHCNLGQIEH